MANKPILYPEWASQDIQDPISQQFNVVEPPLEKKTDGWFLGEKPNRQWWNWYQRLVYDWILWLDQQTSTVVTTDASGVLLFPVPNSLIEISAIDLDDPTSIYKATGIKLLASAPQFAPASIISTNLTLGVGTIAGTQPILGGTNVIVTATSRKIPV